MHGPGASSRRETAEDALMGASRALVAIAARSMADAEDQVTLSQYRALVVLASRGPLRAGDLAGELEVNPSTATRVCDRLVRKGLIERTHRESDRREVELSLSHEGWSLVARVTTRRRRELQRILAAIPAEVQDQLVESLGLFTAAAGELPEASWALVLAP